jgi:predicted NBD/HSP70 family sugar kinase
MTPRIKGKTLPGYIHRRMNMGDLLASRRVLQVLYEKGSSTQAEVAQRLDITLGASSLHFQRLEYEGLIRSQRVDSTRRGRPLSQWEINREHNCTMGLVFNPPHLHLQLEDFGGLTILMREANLSACRTSAEVAACVANLVREAMNVVKSRGAILRYACGALPGVLDPETGAVRRAVNFPALEGLDMQALFGQKFGLPVHVNSLGVAYYYGEANEMPRDRTAMVFYWDLGLGFVFGRNRHLLTVQGGEERGQLFSELGHVKVTNGGPRCHCGQTGCLEAYAGGWVLLKKLARHGVQTMEDLAHVAESGSPDVMRIIGQTTRLLGYHLSWPLQLLGVSEMRVTGPLASLFDKGREGFLEGLAEAAGTRCAGSLRLAVNADYQRSLFQGANITARRAYLYPEDFERLSPISSTLQGQLLAGV